MAISADRDREEWLAVRKTGLGGSDIPPLLGLSPFKTALELWEDKTGRAAEIPDSPPMKRGRVLEPIAADQYVEETSRKIRRQPLRRHPDNEFMIANVDRQILAVGDVNSTGVLEIKCPGLKVMSEVKAHGLSDYMIVQLMHYIGVLGYEWGSFCLFNAERWDIIHFDLEADQEFIGKMFEKEEEFWTKYVLTDTPPPENGTGAMPEVPEVEGELKTVDGEAWRAAGAQFQEAKELVAAATMLQTAAKEKLQVLMTDEETDAIEIPEFLRIYWRMSKGRVSWKKTAEKIAKEAEFPLEYYKVTGAGSRSFNTYFLKRAEE